MNTKTVSQLDALGYFISLTQADESPLEKGVWLLPAGCVDAIAPDTEDGFIAKWNGSEFEIVKKPEPVYPTPLEQIPRIVTMRQARLALLEVGLLSQIESAIDSMQEPNKSVARIEWEYSQEVNRDKDLVKFLASSLNLSEQDLDNLFSLAATK